MSLAQLGNYTFRINPSQVLFTYDVDTSVTNTVGGRVVQAYGATLGDITVQGLFGQERTGSRRESWLLAEQFQAAVGQMVVAQSIPPSAAQLQGTDRTPMHQPVRFVYNDDDPTRRAAGLPIHNWDMMVYIKSLKDVKSGASTMSHETGKFSYGYTLTLFYVEDNTGTLKTTLIDQFIQRLSEGVGWQRSSFNGGMSVDDLKTYLAANSPDGTLHGLILKQYREAATGAVTPGIGATANSAGMTLGPGTTAPAPVNPAAPGGGN
jgi:hypothetical protein